jgi:hypothetical protein
MLTEQNFAKLDPLLDASVYGKNKARDMRG